MQTGTYKPYDNTEVDYTYLKGEPKTRHNPGCPDEIELGELRINGEPAGPDLEEDLYELHGDPWEEKILELIAKGKTDWQEYMNSTRKDFTQLFRRKP